MESFLVFTWPVAPPVLLVLVPDRFKYPAFVLRKSTWRGPGSGRGKEIANQRDPSQQGI